MKEKIDPYFEQRLQAGRNHRVIKSVEINNTPQIEAESNRELPNPILEGAIEEFGWSEKCVENVIDALENGKIKVEFLESDRIRIELLPIKELPGQLGHVSEIDTIQKNIKDEKIFGSSQPEELTYLQTVDFAVEGYMDDEAEGKEYGRLFINSQKLSDKRNIYLDPESLNVTDYEYGYSFCVKGGVPVEAIARIDVIKAKKLEIKRDRGFDTNDWPNSPEEAESFMKQQISRLKTYLETKLKSK